MFLSVITKIHWIHTYLQTDWFILNKFPSAYRFVFSNGPWIILVLPFSLNDKPWLREDTHKNKVFLVVEPLRSGYPTPKTLVVKTIFFIAWKRSKMDKKWINFSKIFWEYSIFRKIIAKIIINFFCWSILTSTEQDMQFFFINFSCVSWGSGHF